ncbi:hypothetical protein JYU12_00895 [bacterium AH-315-K03]|nr:hypothetical protein [bacterium AH-315-K03]
MEAFLTHLAVNQFRSVNTQKIALNALVYLYKRVMGVDMDALSLRTRPLLVDKPDNSSLSCLERLVSTGQLSLSVPK